MRCCFRFLHRAHADGLRYVLVITGKGSSLGRRRRVAPRRAGLAGDPAVPHAWSAAMTMPRATMAAAARSMCGCGGAAEARAMTPFGEKLRALRRQRGVSPEGHGRGARRQRRLSVGAGTWPARRAELGDGAEDHRLLQHHLGRGGGAGAAGADVASARRHRHVAACRRQRPGSPTCWPRASRIGSDDSSGCANSWRRR